MQSFKQFRQQQIDELFGRDMPSDKKTSMFAKEYMKRREAQRAAQKPAEKKQAWDSITHYDIHGKNRQG
jgi:hypothetical protein